MTEKFINRVLFNTCIDVLKRKAELAWKIYLNIGGFGEACAHGRNSRGIDPPRYLAKHLNVLCSLLQTITKIIGENCTYHCVIVSHHDSTPPLNQKWRHHGLTPSNFHFFKDLCCLRLILMWLQRGRGKKGWFFDYVRSERPLIRFSSLIARLWKFMILYFWNSDSLLSKFSSKTGKN